MKLTVLSNPILVGENKSTLKIAGGNVILESEIGPIVVPYSLLKNERQPYVALGQPTYKKDGVRKTSRLSVHMSTDAEEKLASVVIADFIISQAKELIDKPTTIVDFELQETGWVKTGERAAGMGEVSEEDKEWLTKAYSAGQANRAKLDVAKKLINKADGATSTGKPSKVKKSLDALANAGK